MLLLLLLLCTAMVLAPRALHNLPVMRFLMMLLRYCALVRSPKVRLGLALLRSPLAFLAGLLGWSFYSPNTCEPAMLAARAKKPCKEALPATMRSDFILQLERAIMGRGAFTGSYHREHCWLQRARTQGHVLRVTMGPNRVEELFWSGPASPDKKEKGEEEVCANVV